MDWIWFTVQHDNFEEDPPERVPLTDVSDRIRNHPWKEEETAFVARSPRDEPSPAGITLCRDDERVRLSLTRPCRHLMPGDEDMPDTFDILVQMTHPRSLFSLIPLPDWHLDYWFSFPDFESALRLVARYLELFEDAPSLYQELDGPTYREYRL